MVIITCNASCSTSGEKGAVVTLATINGHSITLEEFNAYFKKNWPLPAEDDAVPPPLDIKLKFLNQLIEEYLILMEAERMGVEVTEGELANRVNDIRKDYPEEAFAKILIDNYIDYDEWKEGLKRQILVEKITGFAVTDRVAVSDEEVQKYFAENSDKFKSPEEYHLRQIMTADEKEAERIRQEILRGGNFESLAKEHSIAPEAAEGGDMGWISKGMLPLEMEEEAFSLKTGRISMVVKSPFGYHVFRLDEKREAKALQLEEVAPEIRARLRAAKSEKVYSRWMDMLWEKASIKINYQLL